MGDVEGSPAEAESTAEARSSSASRSAAKSSLPLDDDGDGDGDSAARLIDDDAETGANNSRMDQSAADTRPRAS